MVKAGYLYYIHHFRGLAIVFIVGIHCMNSFGWDGHEFEHRMVELLIDNSTNLFVFISGFLFQYLNSSGFRFRPYFIKKMKFVILPYLIISIPALVNNVVFKSGQPWMPASFVDQPLLEVFYMIITGKHLGPLWFMPMIFIFYLLSPIFVRIDRPRFYLYIFPFILLGSLFMYRFGYFSNNLDSLLYFIPIYMYGMCISHFRDKIFEFRKYIFIPFILFFIAISALQYFEILETPTLSSFAESNYSYYAFSPQKLKMLFLSLIILLSFYRFNHKRFSTLVFLGDYSFGLYFVHTYVIIIYVSVIHQITSDFSFNLISYLGLLALTISISIIPILFIKKIFPRNSRLLIGS